MRGSLHCATHDETVSSFGRDDAAFCCLRLPGAAQNLKQAESWRGGGGKGRWREGDGGNLFR
jgi:hypothetical protein